MASAQFMSVMNYLVPATGFPQILMWFETLVAGTEYHINFTSINSETGNSFWPYGVYMNNRDGIAPLTVQIDQLGLDIVCPTADDKRTMYPGVIDSQTITITGEGPVRLYFMNFPIFN